MIAFMHCKTVVRITVGWVSVRVSCSFRFSVRVSFTVRVSVMVIQVAILSCNCEATQTRRNNYYSPLHSNTLCMYRYNEPIADNFGDSIQRDIPGSSGRQLGD